jgi:hypothetical protein
MKSAASRAAANAPPAPQTAATRLDERSGVKACRPSKQRREGHESSPDHDRPGPSEADKQRDGEIAGEVVELPTERRAGRPIGGAQRDEHDQDHGGYAAKFCHGFDCHSVKSIAD